MISPLETRLLTSIAESRDATDQAIHRAELACYYARVGRFDEAEVLRKELRSVYGDGRDLRVSVLIMTAEALLLYFKDLSPTAGDRVARAKLLCAAAKESRLLALTAAWAAHIDFNEGRFEAMAASIAACIANLHADDGTATCRLALVLLNCHLHSGQLDSAKPWFELAHRSATKIGDQAAIGAMIYNKAALRVSLARIARINEQTVQDDFSLAAAELRSATNYQGIAGLLSLDYLLNCGKASALVHEGKFNRALSEIDSIISSGTVSPNSGLSAILLADRARCLSELGRTEEARLALVSHERSLPCDLSADDLAICYDSLEHCARLVGDSVKAEEHRAAKFGALTTHNAVIARLKEKVAKFAPHDINSGGV